MRRISHLLSLLFLLLILFALPAWAAAETSGSCGADGANLTWVLDDSGTLTISGEGEMADYGDYVYGPWGNTMTRVVIEEGVTSISAHSFGACSELTSVIIPQSVTSIGHNAFSGCTNLSSITALCDIGLFDPTLTFDRYNSYSNLKKVSFPLPGTMTSLNERFINHFPSTVEEIVLLDGGNGIIWDSYFRGCGNLVSITLPSDLKTVRDNAFLDCSRLANVYAASIESWLDISFANYASTPMRYADNLFIDGQLLTNVVIPESTTNIDNHFYGCNSLTSVTIPSSVTSIVSYAFEGCSIQEVHISSLCDWLQIDFGNSSANPLCHGGLLYVSGTPITDVNIPEGVTNIRDFAFSGSSLNSITIPNSVTSIGEYSFYDCDNLDGIELPNSMTSIANYAFGNCDKLNHITLPSTVTSIGDFAFDCCCNLSSMPFPEGITIIGECAFRNCINLSTISLPDSLTSIRDMAFFGCDKLTDIIIPGTTRPAYTLNIPANFTIYCHEYSDVDFWALENGYNVSYLDHLTGPITFKLSVPQPRMEKGTTQTLTVTIVPEVTDPAITWSSSDPTIATVENGVVTAKAPGTVTITATCEGATASVTIEVHANAESFALSPTELWVVSKESADVQINVLPMGAETAFGVSGHDTTTITPSVSGNTIDILALRPGDTTLTVTDSISGLSQTCTVHVVYPVTAVSFSEANITLLCTAKEQLTATVTARDQTVTNQLVTFSSSDETIATVDQQGLVTALAKGTATITATATSGVSASCTVTVRDALTFTLPASLKTLGTEALMNTGAEVYILPRGMTTISARAFAGCSKLTRVIIPASVTSIAADAFEGCTGFVITAPKGSYAHTFALENGIHWVAE